MLVFNSSSMVLVLVQVLVKFELVVLVELVLVVLVLVLVCQSACDTLWLALVLFGCYSAVGCFKHHAWYPCLLCGSVTCGT